MLFTGPLFPFAHPHPACTRRSSSPRYPAVAPQGEIRERHSGERKTRYRPKGVFGKGVGNSKNASEMRQKCVKNASQFSGKRGTFQNASDMRQKCVKNARNTFGGEHLLDDTEKHTVRPPPPKRFLNPPTHDTLPPPPSVQAVISLRENQKRPKAQWL